MNSPFSLAAVQMCSGPDKAANLEQATRWIREAAGAGARLVGLPENFSWMGPDSERLDAAEPLEGPTLTRLADLAKSLGIHLLAGSILEAGAPGGRVYNTSVLLGPDGKQLAVYRKIHLFDVEVHDGATYQESQAVAAGTQVVSAPTPWGRLGLSICYDLRFPELYRQLVAQGATLLAVPSAFTLMTGKDHWEVLLRARAIENQAWVFAPAQGGRHSAQRLTYGHAMVVDPWGLVVARVPDGQGFALARLDLDRQAKIRQDLPCLTHRRL